MIDLDLNERRAEAIRRHRSNPGVIVALKSRILEMVLEDRSAKEIGFDVNLSAGKACRWIHVLGFRRMYVSPEERALLLERRAQSQERRNAA